MTVLRRTWLDGPCAVLDGRPQRENLSSRGAFKGLKIPVSVVRFRPWAPKLRSRPGRTVAASLRAARRRVVVRSDSLAAGGRTFRRTSLIRRRASSRSASLAFELEGDLHLCPVGFHFAVLDLQIELGDLRDAQIPERLRRALDRCRRRLLPRLTAGADQLDNLVDALRHGGSFLRLSLSHRWSRRGPASPLLVLATNPITLENVAGHRGAARIKRRAGSHGGVQGAQGLRQRVPRSPGDVEWAAGARELGAGVRRCRNARTR